MIYPIIEHKCPHCGHNLTLAPTGTGWEWVCTHCAEYETTTSNKTISGGTDDNQSTHV